MKDGVSLPEDKLPVLKAKDGYTDAKWPEEATQPITADDTEFVSSATKLDDIIENPGDNIPAGYHKVTFTAGEGTSIESGTTVFAVKDGVSLPEDKLPVLKAKMVIQMRNGQKKQLNQLQQMIQNLYQVQQNWMISLKIQEKTFLQATTK